MKKINALHGQGFAHPVASQHDISANRKQVISGDWSPINRGEFTLADLGLRHNGNGLVWLRSGVSVHEADHDAGISGKDKTKGSVNGLPFEFVGQWQEYPTKRSFAVSVSSELRRQYYPDDAAFSKAMREAGYVPVRTRKLTGKDARFWLYRVAGNDKGVVAAESAPHKASAPVVQTISKPHPWFKRVALDGKWQYVYADHIRFLTKKASSRRWCSGSGVYRWRAESGGYCMTGKTKAAMPRRQCNTALQKHRQITRLAAGGQTLSQRNPYAQINRVRLTYGHRNLLIKLNSVESTESAGSKHEHYSGLPEHQHCLGSEVPTNNVESCEDNQPSLRGEAQRLCGSLRPAQNLQVTKSHSQNSSGVAQNRPEVIGAVHSITGSNPVQPFGSMPRLFNSALPNSFSQLARLTPSCLASLSNCSFNSGGMRIWNAGALPVPLGCLSRLMIVDMCVPIAVVFFQIGTHLITMLSIKTTPPNGITSTERGLTTTVSESNEAAMKDHITHPQGRKSYIWRFLALSAIGRNVIHITATTEREAREQSPAGCVMVFAGQGQHRIGEHGGAGEPKGKGAGGGLFADYHA